MDDGIICEMVTDCQSFIKSENIDHAKRTCKLSPIPIQKINSTYEQTIKFKD